MQAHRTPMASSSPAGPTPPSTRPVPGPYKFESWTRGEQLVLVRNDDYWGEQALTEKIIFRPIADNAARLQALQTGEIQGYDLVEPQDVPTIEGDANLQLLDRPPFNVGWITINHAKPPMDKLEVRQAVAHAINKRGDRRLLLRWPRRRRQGVHAEGDRRVRRRRADVRLRPARSRGSCCSRPA